MKDIDLGASFDFGKKLVEDAIVQIHGRDYRFRSSTRHENGEILRSAFFTSLHDGSRYNVSFYKSKLHFSHQKASIEGPVAIDDIMGLRIFYDNVTGWRLR